MKKDKGHRMHNSELRLYLNGAFDIPRFLFVFTWGTNIYVRFLLVLLISLSGTFKGVAEPALNALDIL